MVRRLKTMISLTVMTSAVQRFGGLTKMSVCMKRRKRWPFSSKLGWFVKHAYEAEDKWCLL